MKKSFFVIAIFFAVNSFAQNDNRIILSKGQKITVVTSSNADTDMGMGMQMKNISTSTNELNVVSEDNKNYSISNKTIKLTISADLMGQQTSFDSEKPEDKNSEIGKEISGKINVADTLLIDKITGIATSSKKESPERPEKTAENNPLMSMMGGGMDTNSSELILNGAFLLIPKDKKAGDSWVDSTSEKNISTKKNYTIKSIDNDIATILITGTVTGNGETEMQGTAVSFTMDTKSKGETIVNIKTGLVSKTVSNTDATITMDVMGQSMPMSSKISSTITYQ